MKLIVMFLLLDLFISHTINNHRRLLGNSFNTKISFVTSYISSDVPINPMLVEPHSYAYQSTFNATELTTYY
jgi:hypothetical protein